MGLSGAFLAVHRCLRDKWLDQTQGPSNLVDSKASREESLWLRETLNAFTFSDVTPAVIFFVVSEEYQLSHAPELEVQSPVERFVVHCQAPGCLVPI